MNRTYHVILWSIVLTLGAVIGTTRMAPAAAPTGPTAVNYVKNKVNVIAATTSANPAKVTLKWVVETEWFPMQGYNVYRKGPGETAFTKVAGPIRENQNAGPIKLPSLDGSERTVVLGTLLKTARLPVALPANKLQMFRPRPNVVQPSVQAFQELGTLRRQQHAVETGTTRVFTLSVTPQSFPRLTQYMQGFKTQKLQQAMMLKSTAPKTGTGTAPATRDIKRVNLPKTLAPGAITMKAPSQIEQVAVTRRQLMMGSLLNNQVNAALGLGYVDSQVQKDAEYTYQLRAIDDAGKEYGASVGQCAITVGKDPQPLVPIQLMAIQGDVNTVYLRWALDESKTSARVIAYNLYRVRNGQREKLNGPLITIGPVKNDDGQYVDPIWYYTDIKAPVGAVRYELTGLDAFGRETAPATQEITVADWETPLSPGSAEAQAGDAGVSVTWRPSPVKVANTRVSYMISTTAQGDTQALYNVYRYDVEAPKTAGGGAEGPNAQLLQASQLLGVAPPSSGLSVQWTKVNELPLKASAAPVLVAVGLTGSSAKAKTPKQATCVFVDKTAVKDHYYRYCVTAYYAKNTLESMPGGVASVGVPDLKKPAAPAVTATCKPLLTAGTTLVFDATWTKTHAAVTTLAPRVQNLNVNTAKISAQLKTSTTPVKAGTRSGKAAVGKTPPAAGMVKLTEARKREVLTAASKLEASLANSDLGSNVALKWPAAELKGPVRYRVYRAVASGYRSNEQLQASALTAAGAPAAAAAANPAKGSAVSALKPSGPALQLVERQFQYIKRIDPSLLLAKEYTLLSETTSPAFIDRLPKSRPVYYVYRVTTVNRWGVEGVGNASEVRIPATVKPPTPQVALAMPNMDGGVTVTWKPLEEKEETVKYLVYRKQVNLTELLKQVKPAVTIPKITQAPALKGMAFTGSAPMAAAPVPAVKIASPALANLQKLNLRALPPLYPHDARFMKGLTAIIAKPDYQLVGEAKPGQLDEYGNERFVDMKDLTPNVWYSYTVVAVDADGWRSEASKPLLSTAWKVKCGMVRDLKANMARDKFGVTLTWNAPPDEISGYVVQRGKAPGENFAQISPMLTTLGERSFTDYTVLDGRAYTYRVYAIDTLGNLSDPVDVTITANEPRRTAPQIDLPKRGIVR